MKSIIMQRGTKPGNNKAVRQHQAMAQGYVVNDEREYSNDLLTGPKTGSARIPGGIGAKKR